MAVFEVFYRSWMLAINVWFDDPDTDIDFIHKYVTCAEFRDKVIASLELLGIENPAENLTAKQIEGLLFQFKPDGAPEDEAPGFGAAFVLHGTVPKVSAQVREVPTPVIPGKKSLLSNLTSSIRQGWQRLASQATLACVTLYPFRASFAFLC